MQGQGCEDGRVIVPYIKYIEGGYFQTANYSFLNLIFLFFLSLLRFSEMPFFITFLLNRISLYAFLLVIIGLTPDLLRGSPSKLSWTFVWSSFRHH